MSAPHNPPAFPVAPILPDVREGSDGMTLRDMFAGLALNGALSGILSDGSTIDHSDAPTYARLSYALADAMLAAREGGDA